jgi:hypothetical protein
MSENTTHNVCSYHDFQGLNLCFKDPDVQEVLVSRKTVVDDELCEMCERPAEFAIKPA